MNFFGSKKNEFQYSPLPRDADRFTLKMDQFYSFTSSFYDLFILLFFPYRHWITRVLPYVEGPKVLEVSFGSGYLMSKYAFRYEVDGIDFNKKMVMRAREKLKKKGLKANLLLGNAEELPFKDETFDTVINTMAFTGYPDGYKVLSEMKRVLKNGGRLLIIAADYPRDGNIFGMGFMKLMEWAGDVVQPIRQYLLHLEIDYEVKPVGGFGGIYFFDCRKL